MFKIVIYNGNLCFSKTLKTLKYNSLSPVNKTYFFTIFKGCVKKYRGFVADFGNIDLLWGNKHR